MISKQQSERLMQLHLYVCLARVQYAQTFTKSFPEDEIERLEKAFLSAEDRFIEMLEVITE